MRLLNKIKAIFIGVLICLFMVSPAFADLTSETYKTIFDCDGSTIAFDFDFKVFDEDDIEVVLYTVADETGETLTLTTHYSVSDLSDSGGKVTTVATYSSAYQLVVRRDQAKKQELDYTPGGGFSTAVLEQQLDMLVMMLQDMQEEVDRSLKIGITETEVTDYPASVAADAITAQEAAETAQTAAEAAQAAAEAAASGLSFPSIEEGDDNKLLQVNDAEDAYELTDSPTVAAIVATTADINGGTADGVQIGGTTATGELIVNDSSDDADGLGSQGTAGQLLVSAGTGANPTWGDDFKVRAWINFNGTGTIAERDSYNVSGIQDNAVGDYSILWDTDFADTTYAIFGTTVSGAFVSEVVANHVTTSININLFTHAGAAIDHLIVEVIAIGAQ